MQKRTETKYLGSFLHLLFIMISVLLAAARSAATRTSAGACTGASAASTAVTAAMFISFALVSGIHMTVNMHRMTVSAQKSTSSVI